MLETYMHVAIFKSISPFLTPHGTDRYLYVKNYVIPIFKRFWAF